MLNHITENKKKKQNKDSGFNLAFIATYQHQWTKNREKKYCNNLLKTDSL